MYTLTLGCLSTRLLALLSDSELELSVAV